MKGQTDISKYCLIVGSTDVGRKRAANEDSMGNFETCNGLVSVVCDGMGGHVGGATASRIAVDTIHHFLAEQYFDDPREAIGMAIETANKAILAEAAVRPELCGMGSTCVLLLIRDGKVYLGHVGDSRIYLIRTNTITQLTKDHSYVQMLVDCGEITKEQAEHHPRKNEITNALGIPDMMPATIMEEAITPDSGDCFLLCSDGLSGMVSDKEILSIVSKQKEMGTQERADRLVQRANEHGGHDNITVQMVEFASVPKTTSVRPFIRQKKFWLLGVVALLLIGGGISVWMSKGKSTDLKADSSSDSTTTNIGQTDNTPNSQQKKEETLGSVSWTSDFRFISITYSKEGYAEIVLQQKTPGKIEIDELGKTTVRDTFDIASLNCKNDGVEFGAEGNNRSWIKFKKGKKETLVNPDIQFTLKAKSGMTYSFKVNVIKEEQTPSVETAVSTEKPSEENKAKSVDLDGIVNSVKEEMAPTEYEVVISKDALSPFLVVHDDKYETAKGEARINLGIKLPELTGIKKPDFVTATKKENGGIKFSLESDRNIESEFSIEWNAKKKEDSNVPVKIIFKCKLQK